MAWEKEYSISGDITSQKCLAGQLTKEINAAISTATCTYCDTAGDALTVHYDQEPSSGDKALADTTVQDHEPYTMYTCFGAMMLLGCDEKEITEDASFVTVESSFANPSFYIGDLTKAYNRCCFEYMASGTGAEIKMVQTEAGEASPVDLCSTPASLPDTGGSWAFLHVMADVNPTEGGHTYYVKAKRGGATLLKFRNMVAGLLKKSI